MTTSLTLLEGISTESKKIYAKCEFENPTGSMKDRMVKYCLDKLEENGIIQPGMTITEASSGNTGISLSYYGVKKGYSVVICGSSEMSQKKKDLIQNYGGTLKEFDPSIDSLAAMNHARDLGRNSDHYFFNQFENPYHIEAYNETLVSEVVEQIKDIHIDALVAGVGTGASLVALGSKLQNIAIYAVGPQDNPTKIEGIHPGHIEGYFSYWKNRPSHFEKDHILISDDEALESFKSLQKHAPGGICSGALVAATKNLPNGSYLLIFSDHANHYL